MSVTGNTKKDSSNIIELTDVTRSFGYGETESFALKNFNLCVKSGEFIMVMGPSGCGKTTLLNIIGLLDFPTIGNYLLDSKPTARFTKSHSAHIRAKKIGFIFQDFNLIPKITILENVSLPLVYSGLSKTKCLVRSSEVLATFNMQEREYYYPYQLSGGQKQRVAIARAIVSSPEIILADEPTGNLDSRNAHIVMEELRRIHSEGNTIIMVTHNPSLTAYATRVIHMLDGQIATDVKTVADEDLPERVKIHFNSKPSKKSPSLNNSSEPQLPKILANLTPHSISPHIPDSNSTSKKAQSDMQSKTHFPIVSSSLTDASVRIKQKPTIYDYLEEENRLQTDTKSESNTLLKTKDHPPIKSVNKSQSNSFPKSQQKLLPKTTKSSSTLDRLSKKIITKPRSVRPSKSQRILKGRHK